MLLAEGHFDEAINLEFILGSLLIQVGLIFKCFRFQGISRGIGHE